MFTLQQQLGNSARLYFDPGCAGEVTHEMIMYKQCNATALEGAMGPKYGMLRELVRNCSCALWSRMCFLQCDEIKLLTELLYLINPSTHFPAISSEECSGIPRASRNLPRVWSFFYRAVVATFGQRTHIDTEWTRMHITLIMMYGLAGEINCMHGNALRHWYISLTASA